MAWMVILACLMSAPVGPAPENEPIVLGRMADRVRVEIGGDLFTAFVFAEEEGEPLRRPYLYPVLAPGGVEMTRAYPVAATDRVEARDHPHHTSMWFAHGSVNGEDFWHGPARFELDGEVELSGNGLSARYRMVGASGQPIGWHVLDLAFGGADQTRWIDAANTFRPVEGGRLVFGDSKEGVFAVRTHPALRLEPGGGVEQVTGQAVNREGVTGDAVWGKRSAWIHYAGRIGQVPVGIAIFDHPGNPRHPTWWQARAYGLIAANPFGISAFEGGAAERGVLVIEAGESVRFAHRFVFHTGSLNETGVNILYDAWAGGAADQPEKELQP